jgi:hypothetical protein
MVYRSEGYKAVRVSTHAVENIIRALGTNNVLSALTYTQNGHPFYIINFATRTLAYDCATKVWHERASGLDGEARWLGNAATVFGDIPLIGDWTSGNLYMAVPTLATDNGVLIKRSVTLPPIWANTRRGFCARVEIEMEVGGANPAGDVTLEWSDDGGFTWTGGPRVMASGAPTERRKRVFTTRLGSFRQRVFRISSRGNTTLYACDADITGGASMGAGT